MWAGWCRWFQNEPSCVTAGALGVAVRLSWAFSPPFRREFLVHSFIPSLIRQIRQGCCARGSVLVPHTPVRRRVLVLVEFLS